MADVSRLPGPNSDFWDWQLLAACRGEDPSAFFHPDGERGPARAAREKAAKAICNTCPIKTKCADHALEVREPYGVWGGLSEEDREVIYSRRTLASPKSFRTSDCGRDHRGRGPRLAPPAAPRAFPRLGLR